MKSLTCILLYSVVLTTSKVYAANFFAGETVYLGSCNTMVAVGKWVPYNLKYAEINVKASTNACRLVKALPLGPYKLKSFSAVSLDGNNGLPLTGTINIKEVILTGRRAFRLKRIDISGSFEENFKVNLELTIPELIVNVLFEAPQLRLATFIPIDASCNGEIRMSLKRVKINVTAWAEVNEAANIYSLQGLHADFETDDLKIQLVKSNLSNFQKNMAGWYLPNTSCSTVQDLVTEYTESEVFRQVNSILSTYTVDEIKALLNGN